MLTMNVYMIMGECHIHMELWSSPRQGESAELGTKVNWQGPLDEDAPVDDLASHVTSALLALDRKMGEIHEMVLFGS